MSECTSQKIQKRQCDSSLVSIVEDVSNTKMQGIMNGKYLKTYDNDDMQKGLNGGINCKLCTRYCNLFCHLDYYSVQWLE